jgi:anti-sigma factor RsiW
MAAAEHPLSAEELMELLDGELPFERAAVVQAHVAGCDRCQDRRASYRGVSRDLARWSIEGRGDADRPHPEFRGRSFAAWLVRLARVRGCSVRSPCGWAAHCGLQQQPVTVTASRSTVAQAKAETAFMPPAAVIESGRASTER